MSDSRAMSAEEFKDPPSSGRRWRSPAVIGALATLVAAVIGGIFVLLAAREGKTAAEPNAVITILPAIASGSVETAPVINVGLVILVHF